MGILLWQPRFAFIFVFQDHPRMHLTTILDGCIIGSASLARSIRIRFHFRHRTGRIRSVSDHRAGRVWRSRHRSKTPNCLPGARDQVPVLFRNAIERAEPVWIQTAARRSHMSIFFHSLIEFHFYAFDILRRMANPLSLRNWWLHKYDNEDDYAYRL